MTRLPCPECGETAGVPIVWRFPTAEDYDRVDAGAWDVELGGCIVPDPFVNVACRACGSRWLSDRPPRPGPMGDTAFS